MDKQEQAQEQLQVVLLLKRKAKPSQDTPRNYSLPLRCTAIKPPLIRAHHARRSTAVEASKTEKDTEKKGKSRAEQSSGVGKMAKVSVVQMLRNRKRRKWESLGLKSTYLHLSDGTVLHCWLSAGSGSGSGSAVLLMHGFGADGLSGWDTDQIRALSETGAKVMVADLVFFGESRTPGEGRCERFQAATVRAAAQCAGITSVVAVGHSYGGFVAFWMAQLFPDFVGGLVLVSSAVAGAAADRDASVLASLGVPDVRELLVPPSADALARALSVTFHSLPLPWLPRFILNDMLQTLGGDPQLRREVADAIITGSDECKVLPPVKQRCLLVWGQHDRIFPLELGHLLRKHLGDATELVVMDGAGHVPQLEKPGQVTQALLKFLGTVMSSTRHKPKL